MGIEILVSKICRAYIKHDVFYHLFIVDVETALHRGILGFLVLIRVRSLSVLVHTALKPPYIFQTYREPLMALFYMFFSKLQTSQILDPEQVNFLREIHLL